MANRGSFGSGSYEGGGGGYGSYNNGPPSGTSRDSSNDFTRLAQVIENNIQKIITNVSQMQRNVNLIGTQQDSPDLRDKLHQMQHYTHQLAKETTSYFKDLSHLPQSSIQSEQRERKMRKERLLNDFTSSVNSFQAMQKKAAESEKQSVARARAHSGLTYDPFDDRKSDEQLVGIDSPTKQQSVQMEADVDLQLIQEREQAIHKLESDIVDVNTIFKDLGMLVHEQGEVIDSIEANVDSAHVQVEEGTGQLAKARNYQSSARKKKCIILIVLLVVAAIIITIIVVSVKNS